MHRVKLLQFNNITPIVVFDGGYLPLKAATEDDRRRCFSKLFNLLCFLLLPHAFLAWNLELIFEDGEAVVQAEGDESWAGTLEDVPR